MSATADVAETPSRDDSVDALVASGYLWIRLMVAIIGIGLPLLIVTVERIVFTGTTIHKWGSISSFYHSPLRDVFVASNCVAGALLITYMAGSWRKPQYWISTLGGLGLIALANFPTGRPDLMSKTPNCDLPSHIYDNGADEPQCSAVQNWIGEQNSQYVHYTGFITFAVAAFLLTILMYRYERKHHPKHIYVLVHLLCIIAYVVGLTLIVFASKTGWTWLNSGFFWGEAVVIWSFSVSWIFQSREIWSAWNGIP